MKKYTLFTSLLLSMAFAASAQDATFNITNYPAVDSLVKQFKAFPTSDRNNWGKKNNEFWKTIDEDTKDAYIEGVIKIAEDWNGKFVAVTGNPEIQFPGDFPPEVLADADARLAAAGVQVKPCWQWHGTYNSAYAFPRCFENYWNSLTEEQRNTLDPARIKLIHNYKSTAEWPMAAWINHYTYVAAIGNSHANGYNVKALVLSRLPVAIKRALREQGKSFFVDEETGVNPVQGAVNEFIAAMNEPRWGGVQAYVAKWWPNYEWIPVTNWPTDEEINALKEKVYYGEVDLAGVVKCKLINTLGLEKFNEFVEWYNGTSN